VQINLPESATATVQPAQSEHAVVSVNENDEVRLDGNPLPVEELEAAVRNLPGARKTSLALEADKKASFGTIIKVMDALKLAGVKESAGLHKWREMKRRIVKYGDPVLRAKGKRIGKADDEIRALASDMLETMHSANGVGLAAQQVGEAVQLTVLDISEVEDRPSTMKLNGREVDPRTAMPLVLLNPELTLNEETELGVEGCLSFPELSADIDRAVSVIAKAETLDGAVVEIEASGLLARALQHEVDHLNGILFIDRMSSAAKAALGSRLKRLQKETQRG
jgi:peptide deformylase